MQLRQYPPFESNKKSVLKKYPHSSATIENAIQGLVSRPEQGDLYPGFEGFQVRKIRIALPEYKLSSRKGLRLLFLYYEARKIVVPLYIYKKGDYKESQVKKATIEALKQVLEAMQD
ncbi:hypothetical protein [Desulfonatronospira sp.]|uniref:hypothetical protein n=1 Tax=Desulfonatronospira sp. TaxID=1962951 RepID=UPI0025C3B9C1|nr:hypothetical protein [Desulfonatronospira sp.]